MVGSSFEARKENAAGITQARNAPMVLAIGRRSPDSSSAKPNMEIVHLGTWHLGGVLLLSLDGRCGMSRKLRVGIIGGGIGGLALAATLGKLGIESHLFERAPAFGEVGAGIQMTPNAVKVIRELGVSDELRKVSFLPQSIVGRNWHTGKVAFRTPLIDDCPRLYGADFFHTHRADLHRILLPLVPSNSATLSA